MGRHAIYDALAERVLVLDGAMGTMVQRFGLTEAYFRGQGVNASGGMTYAGRFADHPTPLKGCNDVLVLTRPEVIAAIHREYLEAGADIISTDSFNANAISLADYGLQDYAYEISRAAAEIAKKEADKFESDIETIGKQSQSRPCGSHRFVAGSMGPTNRTAALAANADDPSARDVTFDELADAYYDQARGLIDGGADMLLVETVFDTLNAKAALFAVSRLNEERGNGCGEAIPVMVSGTIADVSGRTLSGQTVEAFYASLAHGTGSGFGFGKNGGNGAGAKTETVTSSGNETGLLSIGLNCAFGARQMLPYLERLADVAGCRVSTHPNAGLPNLAGGYDETPAMFAADIEEYLRRGIVNIVGGCCGTTPEHTRAVAAIAAKYPPRPLPGAKHTAVLSGLEPLVGEAEIAGNDGMPAENNLIYVGERANVAGSSKFARLIREDRFDEAVAIARDQTAQGARMIDVCMDDGMIDGAAAMTRFLNMAAAEPELARVPAMIDSSSWSVLEAGLKCIQGKGVVNSISLKEGEAEFLRRARLVRRYGAAAVVMLFDERGQADTYARKIEVAQRAYDLLVQDGFPPEDIIFDPNVLTVATGIAEHDNYAVDFIEATRWIKANLPHSRVSAGVSNLSFAFRGSGGVREAMHSVFLHHAAAAGLDMALVNVGTAVAYGDIEPRLLDLAEDVVLARRPDAAERLAVYAEEAKQTAETVSATSSANLSASPKEDPRSKPVAERIRHAMMTGADDHIAADALEAYRDLGSPLEVIDTMLMPAMGEVGALFGEGKMFLPQVVRSARAMRRAVDALEPYMEHDGNRTKSAGRLIVATVRGDVHDIGKNIVSVVARCNGYEVADLGVMVGAEKIADDAIAQKADFVGLSGLITPSLDEMVGVAREFQRRGLRIPLIIGGATTSSLHTAVKIAPEYDGLVIHARDASDGIRILGRLTGDGAEAFAAETRRRQRLEREQHFARTAGLSGRAAVSLDEARRGAYAKPVSEVVVPRHIGRIALSDFPIAEAIPYINWPMFFAAWEVRGEKEQGRLRKDAEALLARIESEKLLLLDGVAGVFPARRDGDDIVVAGGGNIGGRGRDFRLPQLRNLTAEGVGGNNQSVADYVCPAAQDYVGAFALTAGVG
ncbi:MAG: homocysteine S-methyltransferase family protein, partial [Alistipes sp.]|nr:homocysteine S-methyltransferase family protein [Alistipes sp.]